MTTNIHLWSYLAQFSLRFNSEGRGFDSRWSDWNFSLA